MFTYYPTNVGIFFANEKSLASVNGVPISQIELAHNGFLLLRGHDTVTEVMRVVAGAYEPHVTVKDAFIEAATTLGLPKSFEEFKIDHDDTDGDGPAFISPPELAQYGSFYRVTYTQKPSSETEETNLVAQPYFHLDNYPEPQKVTDAPMKVSMTDGALAAVELEAMKPAIAMALTNMQTLGDLQDLLTPKFAKFTLPVTVSSSVAYRIIRDFVKTNLDRNTAVVTSDYDFCFEVSKKINHKPLKVKYEQLTLTSKSYKPPRFSTVEVNHRKAKIFEMTHATAAYKGYTVHPGFSGDNLQDLVLNIEAYLKELIETLNTNTVECEHCSGFGVAFHEYKFKG